MIAGRHYVHAGISMGDLVSRDAQPMLPLVQPDEQGGRLADLIDHINATVGRDAIGLGLAGLAAPPTGPNSPLSPPDH